MIKRLHNLPIRKKFAVIIIPLIVVIVAFDYLQVRYHFLDYTDSVRLNKAIVVGRGTMEGRPTVDIQFQDAEGAEFVAMITGTLVKQLATVVYNVEKRTR